LKAAGQAERQRVASGVIGELESLQGRLESQLGLGLQDLDRRAADLVDKAESVQRRGAGEGRGAPAPAPRKRAATPMSNRGVTPHANKANKAAQARTRRGRGGPV
jgi:hypothetical protein